MNQKIIVVALLLSVGVTACEQDEIQQSIVQQSSPMDFFIADESGSSNARISALPSITPEYLDALNDELALSGVNYRIAMAEFIAAGGNHEAGQTVLSKVVGNKQLGTDFVPGDARRDWSGDGGMKITYAIDQTADAMPPGGGLTAAQTDAAIERGTASWNDVNCSDLGLTRNNDFGVDIGIVAFINGLGGSPFVFADLQHAGFTDINFAKGVLGVTFTYMFCDPCGADPVFTDIDNNGKMDVAFREIYYDPSWLWAVDGDPASGIDVESIAVHEIGHGLSQGHFGRVAVSRKGELMVSPRAVMNALYTGPYTKLAGTDNGGHCSNWAEWPNN